MIKRIIVKTEIHKQSLYYPQYLGWFGLKWCYYIEWTPLYSRIICFDNLKKAKKFNLSERWRQK